MSLIIPSAFLSSPLSNLSVLLPTFQFPHLFLTPAFRQKPLPYTTLAYCTTSSTKEIWFLPGLSIIPKSSILKSGSGVKPQVHLFLVKFKKPGEARQWVYEGYQQRLNDIYPWNSSQIVWFCKICSIDGTRFRFFRLSMEQSSQLQRAFVGLVLLPFPFWCVFVILSTNDVRMVDFMEKVWSRRRELVQYEGQYDDQLGIYFTTYALYATPYFANQSDPAVILSFVMMGNTFPVIERTDSAKSLTGTFLLTWHFSFFLFFLADKIPASHSCLDTTHIMLLWIDRDKYRRNKRWGRVTSSMMKLWLTKNHKLFQYICWD